MKKFFTTKTIAGLGILLALVIALQIFSNYITFGPVSITLALTPVVLGACFYGPFGGLFLGLVQGALILTAPSTAGFLGISAVGTIFACLLKNGLAGFCSGLIFKLLKEKHAHAGSILAAITAPIVNTGIFTIFAFTVFSSAVYGGANELGINVFEFYLVYYIGINFIIEFAVNSILSPAIYQGYKVFASKK